MRYLGLALYSEGPTDDRFLCPLLERLCDEICMKHGRRPVDVSAVLTLSDAPDRQRDRRSQRIRMAAVDARDQWNILFIHGDGAGSATRALAERVQPAIEELRELSLDGACVPVVPVRETEAWALCDADALRAVFRSKLDDEALGVVQALRAPESEADPKRVLEAAFRATRPTGTRARDGVSGLYKALGESISLDCLRTLPSFCALERGLSAALRRLHYI